MKKAALESLSAQVESIEKRLESLEGVRLTRQSLLNHIEQEIKEAKGLLDGLRSARDYLAESMGNRTINPERDYLQGK